MGVPGFSVLPARREVLDPGDQVGALFFGERVPRRHVGAIQASRNGVVEVFIGGQCPRGGGTALENAQREVTRTSDRATAPLRRCRRPTRRGSPCNTGGKAWPPLSHFPSCFQYDWWRPEN